MPRKPIDHQNTNLDIKGIVEECFKPGFGFSLKEEMEEELRELRDAYKSIEKGREISPKVWEFKFD